jgi:hypothetical protein
VRPPARRRIFEIMRPLPIGLVPLVAMAPAAARASDGAAAPPALALFAGAGFLGGPAGGGAALSAGVRYAFADRFAVSFDLGYGALGSGAEVQDRWWLLPSLALVIATGPTRIDLGAGLGLGTASGFASTSAWIGDRTRWEYQLLPAARLHAVVAMAVTPRAELFARLEAAALLDGNTFGFRSGEPTVPGSTMWLHFAVGMRWGIR